MSRQHQSNPTRHSDRSGYFDIRVLIGGNVALLVYAVSVIVRGL